MKKVLLSSAVPFALVLVVLLAGSTGPLGPNPQTRPLPPRPLLSGDSSVGGPTWARTYGKFFGSADKEQDWCYGSELDADGGLILTGSADTFHLTSDLVVLKIDAAGEIDWDFVYDADPNTDCSNAGNAVARTLDGGCLVVGEVGTRSSTDTDWAALVIKLGPPREPPDERSTPSHHYGYYLPQAVPEWIRSYRLTSQEKESSTASVVRQTADGGFLVGGRTYDPAEPFDWIMKLDPNGQPLWHESLGVVFMSSMITTWDGGFVVLSNAHGQTQLLKFDSEGRIRWARSYDKPDFPCGGPAVTDGTAIASTSEDGFILAGFSLCWEDGESFNWICRLDGAGRIIWCKGGTGFVSSILLTSDGGHLLAVDNGLVKIDPSGSVGWVRGFARGGLDTLRLYPIWAFQRPEGGYAIAGKAFPPGTPARFMAMRLDPNALIDSPCGIETTGSLTLRDTRLRSVAATGYAPVANSARVSTLGYVPYPRPCEVTTVCGPSASHGAFRQREKGVKR